MSKPLNETLIQAIVNIVVKQGGTKFTTLRKEIEKGGTTLTADQLFITSDEGTALVPELNDSLDFIAYTLPAADGKEPKRSYFLVPAGTELEIADDEDEVEGDFEGGVEDDGALVIDESLVDTYFVTGGPSGVTERKTMEEACASVHALRASGVAEAKAFGAIAIELSYSARLAPRNVVEVVDAPEGEADAEDDEEDQA